jgi:hypothetical protein
LTDAQFAWYGDKIRWHRRLPREINLAESLLAVGSWRQPSVIAWDSFARLSRSGEGLLLAAEDFRAGFDITFDGEPLTIAEVRRTNSAQPVHRLE